MTIAEKHHLAVLWNAGDEAQADAFDALMDNAESVYGCDPDSRY